MVLKSVQLCVLHLTKYFFLWIAAVFMALEDLSDLSVAAKTDNKTLRSKARNGCHAFLTGHEFAISLFRVKRVKPR